MSRLFLALLCQCVLVVRIATAAEDGAPPIAAKDLAARLSALQQGSSYVRLVMQIKDSAGAVKSTLQLQIKLRRTAARTDVLYQVLWPKERKGESLLAHQDTGAPAGGALLLPPGTVRPLSADQMRDRLFGSDLSYQDAVENFFAWPGQSLAGAETLNRVNCVILESSPGDSGTSIYGRVRTWIDPRRMVPMRIEKFLPGGNLARIIDTTRVANDDNGHPIPANLTVRAGKDESRTDLDGSRIRHDVTFSDRDFSDEGMKTIESPRASAP